MKKRLSAAMILAGLGLGGLEWGCSDHSQAAMNRLQSSDVLVRVEAAQQLGDNRDGDAEEALITAMSDPDANVRETVAEALGKIGSSEASGALVKALKDPESSVRVAAAEALGNIRDPRTIKPLLACVKGQDSLTRQAAAKALGEIGNPAKPVLLDCLADPNVDVRYFSGQALQQMRYIAADPQSEATLRAAVQDWDGAAAMGKPAVPVLISMLKDKDPEVRRSAAQALGTIRDARAVRALVVCLSESDEATRTVCVDALTRYGSAAERPVQEELKDPDWRIRASAAEALGWIGDKRAVDSLSACMKDSEPGVRQAAAIALGKLHDTRAISGLRAALPDWECRKEIVGTLDELGWVPFSDQDRVYAWIGREDKWHLNSNRSMVDSVLDKDIATGRPREMENAKNVAAWLGKGTPSEKKTQ